MAHILRTDYHVQSRSHARGKITVFCTCKATALDRVDDEVQADAIFMLHVAAAKAASNDHA